MPEPLDLTKVAPEETLIVMKDNEFQRWKSTLLLLSFVLAAATCGLGVIIGYLVWGR